MSRHVELPFLLPWLTFALIWLLLGILVVLAHRLSRGWLRSLEADQRASIVFQSALFPIIAAIVVTFLNFAPGIGGIVVDHHCATGEICATHIPVFCTKLMHAILLTAGPVLLTAIGIWMIGIRLNHSFQFNQTMSRIAEMQPTQSRIEAKTTGSEKPPLTCRVIETPKLFAYCAGFIRGRLIVSRGLVNSLSRDELNAVIAHEQAHSDRYDNLRRLLAFIGLWLVPYRWSRAPLQDMALASETICDKRAANHTGNVQTVISAVQTIMRIDRPVTETLGAAFVHPRDELSPDNDYQHRIDELLDRSKRKLPGAFIFGTTLIIYCYAIVSLTEVAHHVAEYLLK